MNICIFNYNDWNPDWICGIKRVSAILGEEWLKAGHKVYFMSHCTSPLKYEKVGNIPQFFLPNDQVLNCEENINCFKAFIAEKRIDILLNQFSESQECVDLCSSVKSGSYVTLISALHFAPTHFTDILKTSYSLRYRCDVAYKDYLQNLLLYFKTKFITIGHVKKSVAKLYQSSVNSADKVVLLSDKFKKSYQDSVRIKDQANKISAINNPIVIKEFKSNDAREKTIIWCGRMERGQKRLDKMLHIWHKFEVKHPEYTLKVLGGGDTDYYSRLATKMGIKHAEFLGFQDTYKFYAKSEILCMTSVTEGWGMVLTEAQSYGCVPMAFDSFASLTDIIEDGVNGFTVKPFDEDEYVAKLDRLASDDALRARMRTAGLQTVQRFDAHRIAAQWIELFRVIINRNNG